MALQPGRQYEVFPERAVIFVGSEARTVGGDLEEYASRLLEVDRLEPEAIDHLSGTHSGGGDPPPDGELRGIVGHAPGYVVHGADAPRAARRLRTFANLDHRSGSAIGGREAVPTLFRTSGG